MISLDSRLTGSQMKLRESSSLVAELFPAYDEAGMRADTTAKTDVLDMFDLRETSGRVNVGLHEVNGGRTVFGIWRSGGDE